MYKLAGNWAQGWCNLKMFFVLVFYFILMTMYTVHFIETASKFNACYNGVAKQNNTEVNMKKEEVQKSEYKTMTQNQPNHPVNH